MTSRLFCQPFRAPAAIFDSPTLVFSHILQLPLFNCHSPPSLMFTCLRPNLTLYERRRQCQYFLISLFMTYSSSNWLFSDWFICLIFINWVHIVFWLGYWLQRAEDVLACLKIKRVESSLLPDTFFFHHLLFPPLDPSWTPTLLTWHWPPLSSLIQFQLFQQQQCHTLFSRYPSSGDRNGNRVMGNHWAACQVKRQQVVSPPILFHSHPFVITHLLSFYHPKC